MKILFSIILTAALIGTVGCGGQDGKKNAQNKSPAFMFWCFRPERVSSDYVVPDMTTPAMAAYLQNRMKTIPGYIDSSCDLSSHTLTISYSSSTIRMMNFEEAIALSGFSVNGRPANPNAKIPEGVK